MKTLRFLTLMMLAVGLFTVSCSNDDNGTTTVPDETNTTPIIDAQSFPASEAISDTEQIGQIAATDPDDDALGFAIVSNSEDLFAISATGTLSLAEGKQLDFETTAQHTITVGVSDENGGSSSAQITINVSDVDEAPSIETTSFDPEENETKIGTIVASDPEGGALTFEITTDEDELFVINEDGEITVKDGQVIDFETAEKHTITVTVTDEGGLSTSQEIVINLQNVIETLFEDPASFIITIEIAVPDQVLTMELHGETNLEIDWGDGSPVENIVSDVLSTPFHPYNEAKSYEVAFKGQVSRLSFESQSTIRTVEQWGEGEGAIAWESMQDMFRNTLIQFSDEAGVPNLTQCTSTVDMFRDAVEFDSPIGDWNMSNVTNMAGMFNGATSFDQDISEWNTFNVTNMGFMFQDAEAFNQDISGWETTKVFTMRRMFLGATTFSQNLGNWDIGAIATNDGVNAAQAMSGMFTDSGMNAEDLSTTLIGWADDENGDQIIPNDIVLGVTGLQVCTDNNELFAALVKLEGDFGWSNDGNYILVGIVCNP